MFASATDLKNEIIAIKPHDFVSSHLLEPIPNLFSDNSRLWIEWKTTLASALEIDPREIVITGSAAVGFSLNPNKRFSQFHPESDIDVAVISAHHFDLAWRYLRRSSPSWLSLPNPTRKALESHRRRYIFDGTVATDRMLAILPFAKPWQAALDAMSKLEPTKDREVNLRIYRDFDALRSYQAKGIEDLRTRLLEGKDDEAEITTDEE